MISLLPSLLTLPLALPIYGGEEALPCAWPSVVSLDEGGCTGTLIHPQLVVYAGHCGAVVSELQFGEDFRSPARRVAVEHCEIKPGGFGIGRDVAFCRLAEPVLDVPIVPVLSGCETDALQIGAKVTLVGYGVAEDGLPHGPKRVTSTPIVQFFGDEVFIGSDGKDACQGDSGGPALIRLDDGSWRAFGIVSYGSPCGEGTYFSQIHLQLPWLEERSGFDLTPCGDADGTWNPGALCTDFPLDPGTPAGTWADGCSGGPVTDWAATCGAPFPADPDTTPPTVTLTAPGDGSVFVTDKSKQTLLITVAADDLGWGVRDLHLRINDDVVPGSERLGAAATYNDPPLSFPHGSYTLEAVATDHAGNQAVSPAVHITIEPPTAPTTGELPTTGDEPTTTTTTASTGLDSATAIDDEGCGCNLHPATIPLTLPALLLLLRRRRSAP